MSITIYPYKLEQLPSSQTGILRYKITGTDMILIIGTGRFKTMRCAVVIVEDKQKRKNKITGEVEFHEVVSTGWEGVREFVQLLTGEDIVEILGEFVKSLKMD